MALKTPSQRVAFYSASISLTLPTRRDDQTSHPSHIGHLQLWVLHFMLRLVQFWLKQAVCDSERSIGHEQHSELELGDKFTWKRRESYTEVALGTIGFFLTGQSQMWVQQCCQLNFAKCTMKTDPLAQFELPFRTDVTFFDVAVIGPRTLSLKYAH